MKEDSVIHLRGMEFYAYHGVLPEENKLGQKFIIDVDIYLSDIGLTNLDSLENTVNYAEVHKIVKYTVENYSFKLIETLAERIASELLKVFFCQGVKVEVHKPNAPIPGIIKDISVEIHREQK